MLLHCSRMPHQLLCANPHTRMQAAEDALRHTTALRDSALAAAAQEFAGVLHKAGAAAPAAALARLRAAAADSQAGGGSSAAADAAAAPLDLLPEAVLGRLRELAGALLRGGATNASGRTCVRAYAEARAALLRAELDGFLAPLVAAAAVGASSTAAGQQATWQSLESRIPG